MSKETTLPAAKDFSKENVPGLLSKVEEQLKALQTKPSISESVRGVDFPGLGRVNNIDNILALRQAYHKIIVTENADKEFLKEVKSEEALAKLGKYKISGITIDTWKQAIISRMNEINKKDQIKKLNAIKDKFSKYLSEEDQIKNDYADVLSMLKG